MIQGKNIFSNITSIVEKEYENWKGRVESDPQVYSHLKKYWDLVNVAGWTPTGTAWSAAYISWIMRQMDSSFPATSAHRIYCKHGLNNRNNKKSGYKLFSLDRELEPIKCELGDVLVKPRSGDYNASHGDVVYKIEGSTAFLAGGNLGNTNKIDISLALNSDGSYKKSGANYLVVLKKSD